MRNINNQVDSFAVWFLKEFSQYDFDTTINHKKNEEENIDIWNIPKNSSKYIWFNCVNKSYHDYKTMAYRFVKGNRCKYCARTKFVHPLDSLGNLITTTLGIQDLNIVWSNKNDTSPFDYSTGTEKKVWFKCLEGKHEDTLRQVKNAVRSNFICPHCANSNNSSKLQNKVYDYISKKYNVNIEHGCSIRATNPITGNPMPYDNEVVELKLIIEVHGRQHYEPIKGHSKWLGDLSAEEYLEDRQHKDNIKKCFAIQSGYNFLEIPYWSEENNMWVELIENKICEIKKLI